MKQILNNTQVKETALVSAIMTAIVVVAVLFV